MTKNIKASTQPVFTLSMDDILPNKDSKKVETSPNPDDSRPHPDHGRLEKETHTPFATEQTHARIKEEMRMNSNLPPAPDFDPAEFSRKLFDIYKNAEPVLATWMERQFKQGPLAPLGFDPLHMQKAVHDWIDYYAKNPQDLAQMQIQYWDNMAKLSSAMMNKWLGQPVPDLVAPDKTDKRFKDPVWTQNAAFDYLRQAYALTRGLAQNMVQKAAALPENERQKLEFMTRQWMDALSPTNFPMTNPEVLRTTIETKGENLLKGFQNFVDDLKRGQGDLKISTTQYEAFEVGKNLATTPGQVVYRNRMMELIQYAPTTDKVHDIPLLIVPPWINKYYILDMRPDNSFVKYAVDQGYTVFMISWVNPDPTYMNALFDDYLMDGLLQSLNVIESICGTKATNVAGYCIGGTLTSMALSYLKSKGQDDRIASATMLTTLLDFDRAGDMKVFIDEEQITALESRMRERGYLEAGILQKTFSILRANDLIWSFVVNNYMLGKDPFPFDLLYWNEDSTNLPAAFHAYYLRHLYLRNELIKPNALSVAGAKIDLSKIDTPLYFLSTREDHIAPWLATYDGAKVIAKKNKDLTFVLAASGHVAGVINPAGANKKYGYWTGKTTADKADSWLENTSYTEGSWWPDWSAWLSKRSGKMVAARTEPGNKTYTPITSAPGTYVKVNV